MSSIRRVLDISPLGSFNGLSRARRILLIIINTRIIWSKYGSNKILCRNMRIGFFAENIYSDFPLRWRVVFIIWVRLLVSVLYDFNSRCSKSSPIVMGPTDINRLLRRLSIALSFCSSFISSWAKFPNKIAKNKFRSMKLPRIMSETKYIVDGPYPTVLIAS